MDEEKERAYADRLGFWRRKKGRNGWRREREGGRRDQRSSRASRCSDRRCWHPAAEQGGRRGWRAASDRAASGTFRRRRRARKELVVVVVVLLLLPPWASCFFSFLGFFAFSGRERIHETEENSPGAHLFAACYMESQGRVWRGGSCAAVHHVVAHK